MSTVPAPASTAEAMDMVLAGLSYLAAADPTALAAQAQAECLQTLEQADAMATAARARILAAFTAGQGYAADADYSPTSWLIHRTRITKGAARGHLGWARRAAAHPAVIAALAEGTVLTESMARLICGWTGKLPASCRDAADGILVAAARAGARKEDLAALAAEIYARSLPEDEDDPEPDFEDRQVRVETTFAGAGVISGDLTPECAAVVTAVLEALSAPAARRTPGPGTSGITMRWRTRCAAWSPPVCCRSGPGSRCKCGHTCPWPSCGPWTTGRCWPRSGSGRWPCGGPPAAPPPPRPAATAPPGWTASPPARWPATPPSSRWSPAASTPAPWMTWWPCA